MAVEQQLALGCLDAGPVLRQGAGYARRLKHAVIVSAIDVAWGRRRCRSDLPSTASLGSVGTTAVVNADSDDLVPVVVDAVQDPVGAARGVLQRGLRAAASRLDEGSGSGNRSGTR
jgi:hypothetical protein